MCVCVSITVKALTSPGISVTANSHRRRRCPSLRRSRCRSRRRSRHCLLPKHALVYSSLCMCACVCASASDFYETIMGCFLLFAIEPKCCGMKMCMANCCHSAVLRFARPLLPPPPLSISPAKLKFLYVNYCQAASNPRNVLSTWLAAFNLTTHYATKLSKEL